MTGLESTTNTRSRRTYQILLAEDSVADVGIVRIALQNEDLDHVLHIARDGEEAVRYILPAMILKAMNLAALAVAMPAGLAGLVNNTGARGFVEVLFG